MSEGEEHHVKNEDEMDESHKSQIKFEYGVYLFNYSIKIKKSFKHLNRGFLVFISFLRT